MPLLYIFSSPFLCIFILPLTTYAGQYVPLVWGAATAENEAVAVHLNLSKEFQRAYGVDSYEPRSGAVFGVFAYREITATAASATPKALILLRFQPGACF